MTIEANPYQPPQTNRSLSAPSVRVDQIGFSLSAVGVLGLFVINQVGETITTIGMYTAFLCLPGLAASVIGLLRPPRRLAAWGAGLGLFGSAYLPTIYLSLFVFGRDS